MLSASFIFGYVLKVEHIFDFYSSPVSKSKLVVDVGPGISGFVNKFLVDEAIDNFVYIRCTNAPFFELVGNIIDAML